MNRTLIRKDIRLLRNYLRLAVCGSIGCYVASAIAAGLINQNGGRPSTLAELVLMTLRNGSTLGLPISLFFAALLGGSVLTLERSDRSAEFLACLPPSPREHLTNKLTLVFSVSLLMFGLHTVASIGERLLLPHVRGAADLFGSSATTSPWLDVAAYCVFTLAVVGGGLAASAWSRSNGVPVLCGLLTPVLVLILDASLTRLLNLQSSTEHAQARILITAAIVGATLNFLGCYWYLTRTEP